MEKNLAHLQSWLRWVITHPNGVSLALSDELSQAEPRPRMLDAIVDQPPVDRNERLDIYAEGYFSRLVEVLTNDYEHFHRAIVFLQGELGFRKVVSDYIAAHPSRTRTVCDFGQFLPDFLASYHKLSDSPWLAEIARLDWAATRTLYINGLPEFDPTSLTAIGADDWANLKFELDPSTQFLNFVHSVDQVWNQNEFHPQMITIELTQVVVFRQGEFVFVTRLLPGQREILERMRDNETLGEICDRLETHTPESQEIPPVMEWFSEWTNRGIIRRAYV